jgi:glycosyltransferase involved in cell wall biosynthesis
MTGVEDMRVLHVVATNRRRGAEIFGSDLIRSLAVAGVSQRVAVIRQTEVEISFDAPRTALGAREASGWPAGMHLPALRRLRSVAAAWRPDVVQAHGGEAMKYALCSLVATRIPVVYRRVGMAPRGLVREPRRAAYASLMRRAARVVAVCEEVRREAQRLFRIPPHMLVAIPNGVDAGRIRVDRSRQEMRRSLGVPGGRPLIISVGRITWEKDPLAHVRIAAPLIHRFGAVHAWVGEGPLRSTLEREGRRRRLDGKLLLLGSRPDVGDLLSAADIMLFASRTDGMEGMPAAVIEAGMVGLPVAGFGVAGVPEVVVDGRTGVLSPPGDEAALTERMTKLVEDEATRLALGAAARERCMSQFHIGGVADRYAAVYREVTRA